MNHLATLLNIMSLEWKFLICCSAQSGIAKSAEFRAEKINSNLKKVMPPVKSVQMSRLHAYVHMFLPFIFNGERRKTISTDTLALEVGRARARAQLLGFTLLNKDLSPSPSGFGLGPKLDFFIYLVMQEPDLSPTNL
jgi:hypothetical protein